LVERPVSHAALPGRRSPNMVAPIKNIDDTFVICFPISDIGNARSPHPVVYSAPDASGGNVDRVRLSIY